MTITAPETTEPATTEPATTEPPQAPLVVSGTKKVNITLLVDRSGSMEKIRSDVIGGINQFLAEQKGQPGEATLTMILFDSYGVTGMSYEVTIQAKDIRVVQRLNEEDFVPRGGTPLYDALGRVISEIDALGAADVQLLAVFTDGMNNSSKTYDKSQIFEMIEARKNRGWVIALMMANEDAYAEGASMGFAAGSTQAYVGDGVGAQQVYSSFSANTSALRGQVAGGQQVNATAFFAAAGKGAEDDLLARKPDDKAAKGVTGQTAESAE